jgi:hypothetical protein
VEEVVVDIVEDVAVEEAAINLVIVVEVVDVDTMAVAVDVDTMTAAAALQPPLLHHRIRVGILLLLHPFR